LFLKNGFLSVEMLNSQNSTDGDQLSKAGVIAVDGEQPSSVQNLERRSGLRFMGLRTKFLATFILISLVPLCLLSCLHLQGMRDSLAQAAFRSLEASSHLAANELDNFILDNLDAIRTEAETAVLVFQKSEAGVVTPNKADLEKLLASFAKKDPVFIQSCALLNPKGIVLFDTISPERSKRRDDLSDRDYFIEVVESNLPYTTTVHFSGLDGRPSIYFSAPVLGHDGELLGVLRTRYSASILQQILSRHANLTGDMAYPLLIDNNHMLLANGSLSQAAAAEQLFKYVLPPSPDAYKKFQAKRWASLSVPIESAIVTMPMLDQEAEMSGADPNKTVKFSDLLRDENKMAWVSAKLKHNSWRIIFVQPQEVFLSPVRQQIQGSVYFAGGIGLVVLVVAITLAEVLARPLSRLTMMAAKIAGGDLETVHVPVRASGEMGLLAHTFHSMTQKLRERDKSLQESNIKFQTLFAQAPIGFSLTDANGIIIEQNEHSRELLGKMVGKKLSERFLLNGWEVCRPDGRPMPPDEYPEIQVLNDKKDRFNWEIRIERSIYGSVWLNMSATSLEKIGLGVLISYIDISERKLAEERIMASLREKEILLKEIHHRVKNNLQVVSSMLHLQTSYVHDEADRELFIESENRVKSMALVHEKLYQSGDLAKINFLQYVDDLVNSLISSYSLSPERVKIKVVVPDISMSIDKAVPCALILNELISNVFKHAFETSSEGEALVSLTVAPDKHITLVVRDNGSGFPEGFSIEKATSLGLQLVQALAGQLKASIRVTNQNGACFELRWKI